MMSNEKHYITENANLMAEWDWDKNDKTPDQYTLGSSQKVWWKCPKGHSYEARIANRTLLNRNCPYCSGKKVLKGYNDLETWCNNNGREDLLSEWDYDANPLTPSQITAHNNKKVWWKCSLDHKWDATIGSRTSKRPSGCPYCSTPPKKILVGFNDFESWCIKNKKETLLKEWDSKRNVDVLPNEVTYGSGKRVWWKCNRGHEWNVSIANRVQGTGCPVCSRTQTSFPEQAIAYYLSKCYKVLQRYSMKRFEIDIFLEDYNIGVEYDGMYYHTTKELKHEQEKNAFYDKQGVLLIHVKENKTKTCIVGNDIFFIPQKSNYLDYSFNEMLQILISKINNLTGVKTCPDINIARDELEIREQYASIIKNNSVSVVFPELVSEWDTEKNGGMKPENFSANSHTKVWWKCKNGHSWQADISSRNRKLGCPYCAGQRIIVGENDLESWCKTNMPELLSEWNYKKNSLNPSNVAKTSNKKVWWKCSNGHEWEASIANRVHGTHCPICFGVKGTTDTKMSLAEWCKKNNKEHLLKEWDYEKNISLTPDTVSHGSHKKVWWKCSKGHEWEAQIKSRTYNHGCPYCSNTYKKAQVGKNDLATWCKENNKQYILEEWDYDSNDGLTPEMFTFGSHKLINWKCKNGHKWSAVIKERTKYKGNTCPECKMK